jgi:hypothetical protein
MHPTFLIIAAGGILLVVLLHIVLGKTQEKPLPDDAELRMRFLRASNHREADAYLRGEKMAFALDQAAQMIHVLFVHGIHLNLRSFPLSHLRAVRCENRQPARFDLWVRSFDRAHFRCLIQDLEAAQAFCRAVEEAQKASSPQEESKELHHA